MKKKILIFIFLINLFFLSASIFVCKVNSKTIDYSTSAYSVSIVSYSEVIKWLTGIDASQNEIDYYEYLNNTSEVIKVNKLIPKTCLTYELNNDDLSIHAYNYSYTDDSGLVHVWVPKLVNLGSNEYSFTFNGNFYDCDILSIDGSLETINVEYELRLVINKDDCNELINLAYNDAFYFISNKVEETQNAIYNEKLNQFNQYLIDYNKYESDCIIYSEYLIEKENYDEEKAKYDEYLASLDEYNRLLNAYSTYLEDMNTYVNNLVLYEQYLKDLENYNDELDLYNSLLPEYNEKLEIIRHQIATVDAIGYGMIFNGRDGIEERSIKDQVLGSTVTSVLSQKADLAILNADEEAIDRAESATINLREIFNQYFEKTTEQEKYSFYSYRSNFSFVNYKKLKTNMEELLRCLDKLYRSGRVEEALIIKGKKEKYLFLVAQLAYICKFLSDEDVYNYEGYVNGKGTLSKPGACVFDDNWTIDGRTINELLGDNITLLSNDTISSYPLTTGYPSELTEPVEPTIVSEPVMPAIVYEPVEPALVTFDLTEPALVTKPVKPVEVTKPVKYEVNQNLRNILNDFNDGLLIKRNEFTIDQEIILTSSLTKNFRNNDSVTIEFYDDNQTLIKTESTENGSYIVFPFIPVKESNERVKEYIFSHWAYEDEEKLDLNNVTKSGFVHPVFTEIKQEYNVTFIVGENEIVETYYYGVIPEYKGELKKEYNNNSYYEFVSWDKEITSVTKDTKYIALFNEAVLVKDVNSLTIDDDKNCNIIINLIDNLELGNLIREVNDLNNINIETTLYNVNINKSMIDKLREKNCVFLNVSIDKTNNEFNTIFSVLDENKQLINSNIEVSFTLYGKFDKTHTKVNNNTSEIDKEIIQNGVKFNCVSNSLYSVYNLYNINILPNDLVNVSVGKNTNKDNEIVNVNINNIENGKEISSIYYVNSKNEKVEIINKEFLMPSDDIYLGVTVKNSIYLIEFLDDGNVISSKQYKYNEEIIVPPNPSKLSDSEYSYNFLGWIVDEDIVEVDKFATRSIKYNAKYEQVESALGSLDQVRGKIIPTLIIFTCLIIVLPVTLIIIKRRRIQKSID